MSRGGAVAAECFVRLGGGREEREEGCREGVECVCAVRVSCECAFEFVR